MLWNCIFIALDIYIFAFTVNKKSAFFSSSKLKSTTSHKTEYKERNIYLNFFFGKEWKATKEIDKLIAQVSHNHSRKSSVIQYKALRMGWATRWCDSNEQKIGLLQFSKINILKSWKLKLKIKKIEIEI